MIHRKDLIAAVLIVFCLGVTIFPVRPTKSLAGNQVRNVPLYSESNSSQDTNVSVFIWDYWNSDVYTVYLTVPFYSSLNGPPNNYSYQWFVNSTLVPNTNKSSFMYSPTSAGSITVYLVVTDGNGDPYTSNSLTKTLTTYGVFIESNSTTIRLGDSILFNITASAIAPASYGMWSVNNTEVAMAHGDLADIIGDTWTFTPTGSGSYLVYLHVHEEEGGGTSSNSIIITVLQMESGGCGYGFNLRVK